MQVGNRVEKTGLFLTGNLSGRQAQARQERNDQKQKREDAGNRTINKLPPTVT
jgi:hypothetical protein